MKLLNICVDIDGTITNPYDWLTIANKYFNKSLKETDVKEYDIDKVLKISRKEYEVFYNKLGEEIHSKATLRNKAKEILWLLNERHNIFYITAREQRMKRVTYEWFNKNNLPMGEIYLLGSHYKVDKARELNCDLFIEDRYENAIQLALAGFKVLLIDCYYNRQPLIPGILRVYNWEQIYREIQKLETNKTEKIQVIA